MSVDERYRRQVELLVRTLPHVAQERCFAFFIVYLVSHHRPIERLLAQARRDMCEEFERGLAGMMEVPVALNDLVRTREELVAEIVGRMPTGSRCGPSREGNRNGPCWKCATSALFPRWNGG